MQLSNCRRSTFPECADVASSDSSLFCDGSINIRTIKKTRPGFSRRVPRADRSICRGGLRPDQISIQCVKLLIYARTLVYLLACGGQRSRGTLDMKRVSALRYGPRRGGARSLDSPTSRLRKLFQLAQPATSSSSSSRPVFDFEHFPSRPLSTRRSRMTRTSRAGCTLSPAPTPARPWTLASRPSSVRTRRSS